jgi:hypothetical protein
VELFVYFIYVLFIWFSYRQTVGVLETSFATLEKNNISFRRPTDFFTTMAKSDVQMEKVGNLI